MRSIIFVSIRFIEMVATPGSANFDYRCIASHYHGKYNPSINGIFDQTTFFKNYHVGCVPQNVIPRITGSHFLNLAPVLAFYVAGCLAQDAWLNLWSRQVILPT